MTKTIEGFARRHLQWRYFWVEPVLVPAISAGFHLHLHPPHVHLDIHLPLVILFVGNHGLKDADGCHTGADYACDD